MTINEYYGFPEGTIARLDCRLPDMLPINVEISNISNAYSFFSGRRILKFSKDVKYTNIDRLTNGSSLIEGIVDINTDNCAYFSHAFNSEIKYLPIIDISGAKDSDKVAQFNDVAADMKYTFNEIDRILTDEGISPKEYNMKNFKLADDVDTSRVYQHFADSWMYKNFFKKIGILTPEVAKKCDEAALKTKP